MGRHGVLPDERTRDQPFLVDLECELDLSAAGRADRLEHTVDYTDLIRDVRQVVGTESYLLLEALAERVAQVILARPFVDRVAVAVSKAELASKDLGSVGIRIERSRVPGTP